MEIIIAVVVVLGVAFLIYKNKKKAEGAGGSPTKSVNEAPTHKK